jgi:hypothetical protein
MSRGGSMIGKGESRNVLGRIIEVHLNSNVFFHTHFQNEKRLNTEM